MTNRILASATARRARLRVISYVKIKKSRDGGGRHGSNLGRPLRGDTDTTETCQQARYQAGPSRAVIQSNDGGDIFRRRIFIKKTGAFAPVRCAIHGIVFTNRR